jgi:lipid-A-disaccharide synthase
VRIAITANGPGEFAGWLRPLLRALYAADPSLDAHVFCVPDDYATGREAAYARAIFPAARVYDPKTYLRFALGKRVEGAPDRVDRVLYLGGDLLHAARVRARLGGKLSTYRFARKSAALEYAFAVDARNRDELIASGIPAGRVVLAGNLAIDGALAEAAGASGEAEDRGAEDGFILFPGSRRHEVAQLYGFFTAVAVGLRKRLPGVKIAFAKSPFISEAELRRAVETPADPRTYGLTGRLTGEGGTLAIEAAGERFAVSQAPMRAARLARLAISIPGTKLLELAALGIPSVVTTLFNAPELVVINGPLQYIDRIPFAGAAIKRAAVLAFAARFTYFAQPNMDAGSEILPELRGTLFPWRVADVAAERYADAAWCAQTGSVLKAQYEMQAGAAVRIASLLTRR